MPVLAVDQIFTVKIFKNLGGNKQSGEWSNTYHIATDAEIDSETMEACVMDFVDAEKAFHLANVYLDRAVVSTTLKGDSQTLDGLPRIIDISEFGTKQVGGGGGVDVNDCLPLEMAVKINHSAGRGRGAANYYRGNLAGNEWSNLTLSPVISINADGTMVNALTTIIGSNVMTWCLPFYTGTGNDKVLAGYRPIVKVGKGGIVGRQRTARRKKKATVEAGA